MKRHTFLLVICANLVALLALCLIYPQHMLAPGPLVPAHAALATDCFACHTPWHGTTAERCIACHAVADIGLRTTKGLTIEPNVAARPRASANTRFHQHLIEQNCMACHSDHEGPLLTRHARKSFSHALLQPAVQKRCETCHVAPTDALHRQVRDNCAQCHSNRHWRPATFNHSRYFALEGEHNAPCATCHTRNNFSSYTCYGCHEHSEARIRAQHQEEGIRNFQNCVECHRSAHGEGGEGGEGDD